MRGFFTFGRRAQAMVEFVLALPLLLLLIYGIIEVSRLAFIFTSTTNASRAGARYRAASGENFDGTPYYQDCEGIREVVNQSAYITEFEDVNITYDRGVKPDGTQIPIAGVDPSPSGDSCPIEDLDVRNGDRIIVQVSTSYEPIISIVPIDPLEIVSSSARTFIISIPIMGSALPTGFSAETSTPSRTSTPLQTNTPTQTLVFTATRPTYSAITPIISTITNTLPPTLTFTPSLTPRPTRTPTITPTRISCAGSTGVGHGPLRIEDNLMEMGISNNTNHVLFTSQLYVEWNHDTGHWPGEDRTLRLTQISLADQSWQGDLLSPSAYLDGFYPTIPIGDSVIRFTFHQEYTIADGTERIIIYLGTPGCEDYPIDSRK
ncbi:MAG: hypothetical protein FJZ87_11880 [Chloroflexi bacterium]|nr:hypothetical protein [Chloroflexota bacterium]